MGRGDGKKVMFVSRVVARLNERLVVTQVRRLYNLYKLGLWTVCKLSGFLVQFYSRLNGNNRGGLFSGVKNLNFS